MFAATGMMLIAQAADLMILFLGIELMSIALYVLAGFTRTRLLANEASLKYFLLGAFATGFLLYGIALMYGAAGTTSIGAIAAKLPALALSPIFWCGSVLLLTGLAFKAGAVPFHMWIPDVYQGSPTPISGFMATGAKSAAFSALLIVFATRLEPGGRLTLIVAILAAASMILGNVVAIAQTNLKRMLAYSSIAHAGYMLTGLAAGSSMGNTGIAFYVTSYLFMNIGAFGILGYLEEVPERNLSYDDYAGLGSRRPLLAALMSLFMFSLAGIPPFGGFIGKYYMFAAAVRSGLTWLAVVGVLTSVVSVYYYLRLVVVMYFRDAAGRDAAGPEGAGRDIPSMAAILAVALATLLLGVYPSPLLEVIRSLF
jgi:NADH-quinone oxidoreductase subunit N